MVVYFSPLCDRESIQQKVGSSNVLGGMIALDIGVTVFQFGVANRIFFFVVVCAFERRFGEGCGAITTYLNAPVDT